MHGVLDGSDKGLVLVDGVGLVDDDGRGKVLARRSGTIDVEQGARDQGVLRDGGLCGQAFHIQGKVEEVFPAQAEFVDVCIDLAVVWLLEQVVQQGRGVARLGRQIHGSSSK